MEATRRILPSCANALKLFLNSFFLSNRDLTLDLRLNLYLCDFVLGATEKLQCVSFCALLAEG